MNMFLAGHLTATRLIELCGLITKAGGCGVADLGKELGMSKNAARRVGSVIGLPIIKNECLQFYSVPQHARKGQRAKKLPMPFLPFYEALSRSFARHPDEYIKHVREPSSLTPSFYSHPSVQELGAHRCIPLRLFVDGAQLDKQVSTINISMAAP